MRLEAAAYEDRVEDMSSELRAAGEAVANITRKGIEREMELKEEFENIQKAKGSDRAAAQVINIIHIAALVVVVVFVFVFLQKLSSLFIYLILYFAMLIFQSCFSKTYTHI
jgi:Flp pilus assembly protein TadB